MKHYLITIFLLLTGLAAYPQTNPASDSFVDRFIKFYNAGQLDSLHAMFANELKKTVPTDKQDQLIHTLKMIGGSMVKGRKLYAEDGFAGYFFSFEKPAYLLNIALNKAGKIQGVGVVPNDKKQPGDITIKTATSVIKGTLSVPEGSTNMPVALIIAGSGPTDRDGNSALDGVQNNGYLMISDALKLKGIAVLRYDKRGVGQTTTTKGQAENTFEDDLDDALAIVKFLKADKRFSKVIIAGHSEGSLIGMLACDKENADAFISLAGAGFPADVLLKKQIKEKLPKEYKKAALIIDSIKAGKPVKQSMDTVYGNIFTASLQPYWHTWMQYDPASEIKKVKVPILIIQGTNDTQVSVADAKSLKKASPNAQIKLITGMIHILKDAPADKEQSETTGHKGDIPLSKELIPTLTDFINSIK
jgi:pimeloyl-ACP methyl ester carboxylesterase